MGHIFENVSYRGNSSWWMDPLNPSDPWCPICFAVGGPDGKQNEVLTNTRNHICHKASPRREPTKMGTRSVSRFGCF